MTTTFFKATRPDGTSFHDGTTRWQVGRITRLRAGSELPYLSVATVPTNCTGMKWPCRLFEVRAVRGHKVTAPDPHYLPNKRGSDAWMVVRELPAHDVFGPQGEHVAALIERASQLTDSECRALRPAWSAAWEATRDATRDAAWDAAWDATRDAARVTTWNAARGAMWNAARDAARDAAWEAAWDATWDAALALLTRDLIITNHYNTLTRAWRTTIGPIHPDDPEVAP